MTTNPTNKFNKHKSSTICNYLKKNQVTYPPNIQTIIIITSFALQKEYEDEDILMESLKITRNYFYTIIFLASLLQTTFVSTSSNPEIIVNGGFEEQFKGWDPFNSVEIM